jgi:epoxyqueuosine reductase
MSGDLTQTIKQRALELGFDRVAVTGVAPLKLEEHRYHLWLNSNQAADLQYMIDSRDLRAHPTKLLAEACSIISLAVNYYSGEFDSVPRGSGRVARYAWGLDYHEVIPPRLRQLVGEIEKIVGHEVRARCFTDAVPLLERAVARTAGIGRVGLNSCLITDEFGSWVFLSEILLDLPLAPDIKDGRSCKSTHDCLKQCPTGAIVRPYVVDARLCISYHTIENRAVIPRELRRQMGDWLFGCDVCQEVCPHNNRIPVTSWREFHPESGVGKTLLLDDVLQLDSDETFRERFRNTALVRTKRRGLVRNAAIVAANTRYEEAVPRLRELASSDPDEIVRGHTVWALAELDGNESLAVFEKARHDPSEFVRTEAENALLQAQIN